MTTGMPSTRQSGWIQDFLDTICRPRAPGRNARNSRLWPETSFAGEGCFPGSRELVLATARLEAGRGTLPRRFHSWTRWLRKGLTTLRPHFCGCSRGARIVPAGVPRSAVEVVRPSALGPESVHDLDFSAGHLPRLGKRRHRHPPARNCAGRARTRTGLRSTGLWRPCRGKRSGGGALEPGCGDQDGGGKSPVRPRCPAAAPGHPREALAQLGNALRRKRGLPPGCPWPQAPRQGARCRRESRR